MNIHKIRDKKDLLVSVTKRDLTITWYNGHEAGGQHKNKHANCCRIQHKDSGVLVIAGEQRSREQNLRAAFRRLSTAKKFQQWLNIESAKAMQDKKEVEKQIWREVHESVKDKNLKVEYFDPGEVMEKEK